MLIEYKGSFSLSYFKKLTIDNFIKEIYYLNKIIEEKEKYFEDIKNGR